MPRAAVGGIVHNDHGNGAADRACRYLVSAEGHQTLACSPMPNIFSRGAVGTRIRP